MNIQEVSPKMITEKRDSGPRQQLRTQSPRASADWSPCMDCRIKTLHYGANFLAVRDTGDPDRFATRITAFIGPSGCGKSTVAAQPVAEPDE